MNITSNGIFTKYLGETISFPFLRKPISKRLNLIQTKQNQINFLKEEISFKNIENHLSKTEVQKKIQNLLEHIQTSICSDLPNAFWQRKKHVVNLPYEKDFHERQIPTKARPIQMNEDLLIHCKKEINDLLAKGLICKSKSPWSCSAFYVNKQAEIE